MDTPFTVNTDGVARTFNITSSLANLYAFNIIVTVSGGSNYSGNVSAIESVDPSALTIQILENPPSIVYEGQNAGITIDLINSHSAIQTRNLTIYENKSNTFSVNESLGSDTATQTIILFPNDHSVITWNVTIGSFTDAAHVLIRVGERLEAHVFYVTKATTITTTTTTSTTTTLPTTTTTTTKPGGEITGAATQNQQTTTTNEKSTTTSANVGSLGEPVAVFVIVAAFEKLSLWWDSNPPHCLFRASDEI